MVIHTSIYVNDNVVLSDARRYCNSVDSNRVLLYQLTKVLWHKLTGYAT